MLFSLATGSKPKRWPLPLIFPPPLSEIFSQFSAYKIAFLLSYPLPVSLAQRDEFLVMKRVTLDKRFTVAVT